MIYLEAEGPTDGGTFRFALDSGPTSTTMDAKQMMTLGYFPKAVGRAVSVATGSRMEVGYVVPVARLTALERSRSDFPVVCLSLPAAAGIDGVIGLDFLRGHVLKIDFNAGLISLD